MNKKVITIVSSTIFISLLSFTAFASSQSANKNNNTIKINSNRQAAIKNLGNIKINNEEITDKTKINEKISFKIEKPTIDLGELKEVNSTLKKERVNENDPKFAQNNDYYTEEYAGKDGKQLLIIQSNAVTEEPLSNPINLTEKTTIKGYEAYICEANNSWTQVMYKTDKKFYNIAGYKVPKAQLIKIAESLN